MRSGLSPSKTGPRPPPSPPIRRSSAELHVVEEQRPLLVRAEVGHRYRVAAEARGVHVHEAQRRQPEAALRQAAARHHQHGVGVLHARDVGLLAVQHEAVAATLEGRGEVVRVGARVGLGDREGHLRRAGRDPAQPDVLLLLAAVPGQDRAHDRGRDHDQQQRLAGRRDLLAHRGQAGHAEPAAAPLLGQVDAQVALGGQRVPELGGRLSRLVLAARVVGWERVADAADGGADLPLLVGGHEIELGHEARQAIRPCSPRRRARPGPPRAGRPRSAASPDTGWPPPDGRSG